MTIAVASFIIPSPNNKEFKIGYFASLTKLKAATVSVAHSTAANSKISYIAILFPSKNNPVSISKIAQGPRMKNVSMVPTIP